jgi:glucose/arabinose dehydrogenase
LQRPGLTTLLALALGLTSACGSSSPAVSPPISVQGTEHFAWNQEADSADAVASYTFLAYVDDAPLPVPDAVCTSGSTANEFNCSARLPAMAPGAHRFQLASAALVDGVRFESPRSTALNLVVTPTSNGNAGAAGEARMPFATADGTTFAVETVGRGLDAPSGLAVSPDGRVFVAERAGAVRLWKGGRLEDAPMVRLANAVVGSDTGLVGIAIHPDFARNGQVYLAYTARADDGKFINRVVRFRDVADTLGEAAVLLEDATSAVPLRAPHIRFGPDGKMYVAFPSDAATARDSAGYSGKILRLNDDGTTPRDNPGYSPILADDKGVPIVFGWQPTTSTRWQLDRDWTDEEVLFAPRATGDRRRLMPTPISPAIDPSGASFYAARAIAGFTGDLFISALDGRQIHRIRFDSTDQLDVVSSEPLLQGIFGRIGDIVEGADGALYFATSNRSVMSQSTNDDDRLLRIVPLNREKEAVSRAK